MFGLAPIPLLIDLGRLLTDKTVADVYQLHREPPGWQWTKGQLDDFRYLIKEPQKAAEKVAVVLSLSATIPDDDVYATLGSDTAIWRMTIEKPHNDFMQYRHQLSLFRKEIRALLDEIKARHGKSNTIHLFPAIPVSAAIELGRVWMPKADLPIIIYDRNRPKLEFIKTFQIG